MLPAFSPQDVNLNLEPTSGVREEVLCFHTMRETEYYWWNIKWIALLLKWTKIFIKITAKRFSAKAFFHSWCKVWGRMDPKFVVFQILALLEFCVVLKLSEGNYFWLWSVENNTTIFTQLRHWVISTWLWIFPQNWIVFAMLQNIMTKEIHLDKSKTLETLVLIFTRLGGNFA